MAKLDLKKINKELYYPKKGMVSLVTVPPMNFLMIDGQGNPNTSLEYKNAMEALFPVAYKIKFLSKKELGKDYVVMPLEGLWWTENMEEFSVEDKNNWEWTSMIRQPDFITPEILKSAINEVEHKKDPVSLEKIRFEVLKEGLCVQTLHIGPYSEEGPTVSLLHDYIHENGYQMKGSEDKHHEIYLSDMRRTKPERLKTVIRQPIKKRG